VQQSENADFAQQKVLASFSLFSRKPALVLAKALPSHERQARGLPRKAN
jgi:hypothetical protein